MRYGKTTSNMALKSTRLTNDQTPLTSNEAFQAGCIDTGELPPTVAMQFGATGPVARSSDSHSELQCNDRCWYSDRLERSCKLVANDNDHD